ncbi:MAG: SGNH/GDSL hydrolase family protein [Steroidobacteraceae bacterium]
MSASPQSGFAFAARHPLLANLLLVIVSLLVGVLMIDLVTFYLLGMRPIGWAPQRFFQHSSLLGWEHIPYAEGTWYAYKDGTRTHVSINAYGFPDDERTVTKDRPRIALFGDSTTEYWEVEADARPQRVMPQLMDGRTEVLNFALRGAGTDQALLTYRHLAVHFAPDVVVLTVCINDFANNAVQESKPWFVLDPDSPGGIRLQGMPIRGERLQEEIWWRELPERSFTLRQLKYAVFGMGSHFRTDVPLAEHPELRPFRRAYDAEDERRKELLERLVAAFANFSREHGARFLLVEGLARPVLDKEQRARVLEIYGDVFDFGRVTRAFEAHSARAGYEFLSLPGLVRKRGLEVGDLMHPHDTMHLNAEGARVFSAAVVERLRALGWIEAAPAAPAGTG